jgi:hypothetical protein
MKNKTIAVWLTLLTGPLGLQRIYLTGRFDMWSWLAIAPSVAGAYGVTRARSIGLDDHLSWLLIPFLGFCIAACALAAIVYGLTEANRWNQKFNPMADENDVAGQTNWLTVMGLGSSLLMGTTALMATLAFSFQRYFEIST